MKAKTRNITLIVIGVLAIVGLTSLILIKRKKKKPNRILLLGGLDYRSGDKNIDEQVGLLKKGSQLKTKGFRYSNSQGIIQEILESKRILHVKMILDFQLLIMKK